MAFKRTEAATLVDLLDGISAGMFLVNARGRIVHANASGHALLAAGAHKGTRVAATRVVPYEIQRDPAALAPLLDRLARGLGAQPGDAHAVTMTAELSQLFRTKREGVAFVLEAVTQAFPDGLVRVYAVDGRWRTPDEARRDPLAVAAANWAATARTLMSSSMWSFMSTLPAWRTRSVVPLVCASSPMGISHRPACRIFTSRSRSAGPSGPYSVCTQPSAAAPGVSLRGAAAACLPLSALASVSPPSTPIAASTRTAKTNDGLILATTVNPSGGTRSGRSPNPPFTRR